MKEKPAAEKKKPEDFKQDERGQPSPRIENRRRGKNLSRRDSLREGNKARGAMTNSIMREVYASPNGDKWALARNGEGELVVYHQPSPASGGVVSEIAVDVFLSHAGGPVYQALSAALAELKLSDKHLDDSRV